MKKSEKIQLITFFASLVGMGLAVAYSLKEKGENQSSDNLSRLEQFAEQDGKKGLSITEEAEMYRMCGVGDKSKNYVLTKEDIERGIKAYEAKFRRRNYRNGRE